MLQRPAVLRCTALAGVAVGLLFGGGALAQTLPNQPSALLEAEAYSIVDRTLLCTTAFVGGARTIKGRGHRGTGRAGDSWARPAFVAIETGAAANGGPQNPTILDSSLIWLTGGRPSPTATLVEGSVLSELYRTRLWGTLALNTDRCNDSKRRVGLSAHSLQGDPLGSFEASYKCFAPRRVVVRVRAAVSGSAALTRFRAFRRTTVPVRQATVVIQTEAGKPLFYAEVSDSGRARLLTSPDCFPS